MALTLWILERRRPLWMLPPLFVFWANAHGGYFMGWVLLGAYCGEALFQRLRKQPPTDEKTLWAASLLAILASGLNPTYFNVIPGMFAYQQSLLQEVAEGMALARALAAELVQRACSSARPACCFGRGAARAPRTGCCSPSSPRFSLMAQRNVILIGLIAPIVIAIYLPEWKRPLPRIAEFAVPLVLLADRRPERSPAAKPFNSSLPAGSIPRAR